jgi:hypothetical protein
VPLLLLLPPPAAAAAAVPAGEVLLGDLARAGFDITSDHEAADAIVVNTCAFVEVRRAVCVCINIMVWCGAGAHPASYVVAAVTFASVLL